MSTIDSSNETQPHAEKNVISYSVFLEQQTTSTMTTSREPLRYTLPRKIYTWVEDNSVTNCYNCTKEFALVIRRHHCRFCGRIFCYQCSNYQATIPKELLSDDSKKGTWNEYFTTYVVNKEPSKYKVCKSCLDLINTVNSVKKLVEVFIMCDFDIKDLKKIGKVCKLWQNASNYLLSIFREIQYKLPNDTYSELEIKMLWNNAKYLSGHNKYGVHLIKICKNDIELQKVCQILKSKKQIACLPMLCSRNCYDKLTSFDSINLLTYWFNKHVVDSQSNSNDYVQMNNNIKTLALDYLNCNDRELKCYIPMLVYYLRYDNGTIVDFLINRCLNNFKLLNALWWELQLYPKDDYHDEAYSKIIKKLQELFSNEKHEKKFVKLLQGTSLVQVFQKISNEICDENKKYDDVKDKFHLKNELVLPLNVNVQVKDILINKIKIKSSATRPLLLPCTTPDGKITNVLFKKEDVRKDQIIMNLINIIDIILKKDENIDLNLVCYNVLPINKMSGLIEIVDESDTIYYIQEKIKSSILNYILEHNPDIHIKDLRERFIRSTAAYCVITYILGIGDRHLDNIMITKNGRLFHIDFGFILGKDPVLTNTGIRITPEIVEAIGGYGSVYYEQFTSLCNKIYNCLRRNIDIFMNMLLLLPKISDINVTEKEIIEQILKRFVPGCQDVDAQMHLISQLENQTYVEKVKDWFHYHSKEQTFSGTMNRLSSALSNLWVVADNGVIKK